MCNINLTMFFNKKQFHIELACIFGMMVSEIVLLSYAFLPPIVIR